MELTSFFHWFRKNKKDDYMQHIYQDELWTERVKQFKQENKFIDEYMQYCKEKGIDPIGI